MKQMTLDTSQELTIDIEYDTQVEIQLQARSTGNLVLFLQGEGKLTLNIDLQDHSDWHILMLHSSGESITVHETISLHHDAQLTLGYGDFSKGVTTRHTDLKLVGQGALVITHGALMVSGKLDWILQSHHLAKDTYAALNTNAVITQAGYCRIEVIGSIPKGNHRSKTHQMTKILNLGDTSTSSVYPKLLIDENDVEASHAASVGQPEEEHVYYLMSRGLSRQLAMRLIIKGYLHPVVNLIEDESIKEALLTMIEEEVMDYE